MNVVQEQEGSCLKRKGWDLWGSNTRIKDSVVAAKADKVE